MAAKSNETPVVETEAVVEEITIPLQRDVPEIEIDEGDLTTADRVKSFLANKKFIAGVTSVALIAVGVFVIKKQNENKTVSEDEVTTD